MGLSESAAKRIGELIAMEGDASLMLRLSVSGGGCSGFQYGFSFDNATQPDDHLVRAQRREDGNRRHLARPALRRRGGFCRGPGRLLVPGQESERHFVLWLRELFRSRLTAINPDSMPYVGDSGSVIKVASFNVNSLRARIGNVLSWLTDRRSPMSCCCRDQVPRHRSAEAGDRRPRLQFRGGRAEEL